MFLEVGAVGNYINRNRAILTEIENATKAINYQMAAEPLTGSLLKTLAASKPNSNLLELGTGTGISTTWLLAGMDDRSQLISIENDPAVISIAQKYLGHDKRVTFELEDGEIAIDRLRRDERRFDLIFADTWAGKYTHLSAVLNLLKHVGLYIIDDTLPQANWPEGHEIKVGDLITRLETSSELTLTKLNWAGGIILCVKH
jgi:predicted O-methyltransferase YrrM